MLVEPASRWFKQLVDPPHNRLEGSRTVKIAFGQKFVRSHRCDYWRVRLVLRDVVVSTGPKFPIRKHC